MINDIQQGIMAQVQSRVNELEQRIVAQTQNKVQDQLNDYKRTAGEQVLTDVKYQLMNEVLDQLQAIMMKNI